MNKIDISTPSTVVLSQYPNYNAGDQYLTQIGTFTIWVDTTLSGTANIVLPSVSAFRLRSANFKIFDVAGQAGTNNVIVSFEDGALVNGASSITLGTNYGNLSVQLQDGEWFGNLNGTGGGGGGLTGANNGTSTAGDLVQLGGSALIKATTVTGLETYPLSFQSTDGSSFLFGAGNLAAAPYSLGANSFMAQSNSGEQLLSMTLNQGNYILLLNQDTSATVVNRVIAINSGLTGNPGINIAEKYILDGFQYQLSIGSRTVAMSIYNPHLPSGNQVPVQLGLSNDAIIISKYISNTATPTSASSGLLIDAGTGVGGTNEVLVWWNGGTNGSPGGTILSLNAVGMRLAVSGTSIFTVSPTGEITTSGMPTSDPHVVGQLYSLDAGGAVQISNG